jgi:hypothetical protein
MARIVLHSEQRNLPGFVALSFFAQIGQANILGNRDTVPGEAPFRKKFIESSRLSLILKN